MNQYHKNIILIINKIEIKKLWNDMLVLEKVMIYNIT